MKNVAVIGTGPAGMSAAYVLAKAGFKVTVFEKTSTIGGKVTSYQEDGKSFEHGIHGWWNNYKNFDKIIKECGIKEEDIFKKVFGSNMITKDGNRYALKIVKFPLPSPLFMIWQLLTAPYLNFKDVLSVARFGIVLFGFDQTNDYEKYDKLSFQELMDECKVSERLQKLVFTPFILSYDFTIPARVSAACGLSGMHFYIIRDQLSVCARWLKGTPNELIFDPMRAKMEKEYKVKFIPSAKVSRINLNNEKRQVISCEVSSNHFESTQPIHIAKVKAAAVPETGFLKLDGHNILIGKLAGNIAAFDTTCSHNGCAVDWNTSLALFECPCHGGKYNADGSVHSGPPPAPLKKYIIELDGENFTIKTLNAIKTFEFDDIIIATDVVNAKNILINSLPITHTINRNIAKLDTTPAFVARIWFKGINYEPEIDSAITPDFKFIDNYFNLNSFSENYNAEGHLIEVQAYRVFSELDKSDNEILQLVLNDLRIINPQYSAENLTLFRINRHLQLFTRYAPRLNNLRPKEESGIHGLYFAGDWTSFNYPVWMMERGVSSGIRAANTICEKYGAKQHELIRLDKGSLLFRFTRRSARLLLKIQEISLRKFWGRLTIFSSLKKVHIIPRTKDSSGLYFQKPSAKSWWDWTVFLLHTAAEIEHSLMVQYLFSGYSINPAFGTPEYEMVTKWKNTILSIAVEEMGHLLTVQSVLKILRAPTNFEREDYPYRSEFYPFPFTLERFSKSSLARYIVTEMPDMKFNNELKDILKFANLNLNNNQINSVGILYEDIINIVKDENKIPSYLFEPKPENSTIYKYWSFTKDLICEDVIDRDTVISVLKKVAEQGEGLENNDNSHFERFIAIYREFDTIDKERVPFVSVNVDPNPTLQGIKNRITETRAILWNEIFNIKYRLTICFLNHLLHIHKNDDEKYILSIQNELTMMMHVEMSGKNGRGGLRQISERLFSLPLSENNKFGLRAGPSFELAHTLTIPDNELSRWYFYRDLCIKQNELIKQLLSIETEQKEASFCLEICESILLTSEKYITTLSLNSKT